ncbi:glycine betaine ABC transporter substrate-binding protein [Methanohalophilus sp. RSK]|uniref:glycine betaine ABC transporter substrate-binding protein n=1 Tax=Methanohalophilus sp. RSK TaxID=2485783 RepID=UPI000F439B39|nr:glycine betaine ABC transporter substrate-binding protein [Methanohalophilus sp. RSK]RNI13721.1 glycine betaine ABC transporter substrate-binding protein [Methanohalophilus sp. RSK]
MDNKLKMIIIGIVLVLSLFAAGCTQQESEGAGAEEKSATIGYVMWDDAIANTNVIKQVLEQEGYEVEIIAVDAGPLYQGLADGQFDFTTCAWLPQTQANYWEQYGDQVDRVGPNLEDCKLGLVVPTYMEDINSIEDLNANKEKFNGKITGIDPGAGIMQNTENAIDMYGLGYTLEASSSAGMASALDSAYRDEEPIVVTLWTPHWAFGRYDLKILDDPQKAYGDGDNIETLARQGLEEEKPELYAIISNIHYSHEEIQTVMTDIEAGMSAEEAAAKWVENNPDRVNEWIGTE